jgi:hypothetical protein
MLFPRTTKNPYPCKEGIGDHRNNQHSRSLRQDYLDQVQGVFPVIRKFSGLSASPRDIQTSSQYVTIIPILCILSKIAISCIDIDILEEK